MSALNELLISIFGQNAPKTALYDDLERWVKDSRRFKAFALQYGVKIRSKLRNIRDEGGLHDLRAELAVAALLLTEARFTLEYEKYSASRQRGPDFTVTFRTHTPFNVEVRRIRGAELDDHATGDRDADVKTGKLMAVLCDKVGQMPPSIINVLWLTSERGITEDDLAQAAVTLRQMAERKTDDYFQRRGFRNAVEFLRQYAHLSGIVLHGNQAGQNTLWLNPLARHKIPPEMANILRRV